MTERVEDHHGSQDSTCCHDEVAAFHVTIPFAPKERFCWLVMMETKAFVGELRGLKTKDSGEGRALDLPSPEAKQHAEWLILPAMPRRAAR